MRQRLAQVVPLGAQQLHGALLGGVELVKTVAPGLLGGIHGLVGMAQQGVGVSVVLREDGVANAGRDDHALGVQRVRGRDAFHHAAQNALAVGHRLQPGHQDHELVAPEPGHRVHRLQCAREPAAHHHQQAVARAVAQAVVHGLETVQVQVGHAQLLAGVTGLGHTFLQLARQQHSVGQAGEGVVQRQALQHDLLLALRGHVDGHTQHAGWAALLVKADDLAQVAHPAHGLARLVQAPGGVERCAQVGGVARIDSSTVRRGPLRTFSVTS